MPSLPFPSISFHSLLFSSVPLPVDAAMIAGVSSFLSARATACQRPAVRFANLLSSLFAWLASAPFAPSRSLASFRDCEYNRLRPRFIDIDGP